MQAHKDLEPLKCNIKKFAHLVELLIIEIHLNYLIHTLTNPSFTQLVLKSQLGIFQVTRKLVLK